MAPRDIVHHLEQKQVMADSGSNAQHLKLTVKVESRRQNETLMRCGEITEELQGSIDRDCGVDWKHRHDQPECPLPIVGRWSVQVIDGTTADPTRSDLPGLDGH